MKPNNPNKPKLKLVFIVDSQAKSDALLPIYELANADPNCDAYWIPVPLYELGPGKKIANVKFDGQEKYPNVPCTNFTEYDFKNARPDAIFTNNIYDNENYVTQLQPEFWSRNLKKHTDCLVYIPYFVTGNSLDQPSFVRLSGMISVDLVILENENIRKFYADTARRFFGGRLNLNKFVAIGSPKYDETLKYAELAALGKLRVPVDWIKKICKPGGAKRKIVFYNTGLAALLKLDNPMVYCEKVENVLAEFKRRMAENDDVVLLWRPHPLILTTIKSMRPIAAKRWEKIVRDYKQENFGIYDESGDMHRAVAISDCYYGDGSSIMQFFNLLGKKVFIQSASNYCSLSTKNIIYTEPKFSFVFKTENGIYAVDVNDYIFKFNAETKKFAFVTMLPKTEKDPMYRAFNCVKMHENSIYFLPYNGDKLAKYDAKRNEFEFYELNLQEKYISQFDANFSDMIFYGNKIFFIPCSYRAIFAYNFDTGESEYLWDLRTYFTQKNMHENTQETTQKTMQETTTFPFCGYEWLNENTVLMPSLHTNEVFEFCLEDYKVRIHKLGNGNKHFHAIMKHGDDFFLIGKQPFVAKFNYEKGEFAYYNNFPKGFEISKRTDFTWSVNGIKPYDGKIILLGNFTNMALEFDFNTCEYRKIESIKIEKATRELSGFGYSTCNFTDGENLYFVRREKEICVYNMKTGEFKVICRLEIDIPDNVLEKLNDGFFNRIVNDEVVVAGKAKLEPCSGKIYEYVKKFSAK